MEGSLISAARTAASAVLGAYWLNNRIRQAPVVAFIGAGIIARNILDIFVATDWNIGQVRVHDMDAASANALADHAAGKINGHGIVADNLEHALQADIVVFATNAGTPYVGRPQKFRPGQIVLNVSLRDLAPELILDAENIFDDVDHCMKANTSPHLAEQQTGNRDFVTGTLAALIRGEIALDRTRPLIFSPFGMGILDLALGVALFEQARSRSMTVPIAGFFGETTRW
jgi:ornithine cyclodeaminase/alanine dehydrogenase-like protein (mu-crystallin family)